jgi:hypothetical protein
MPENLTIRPKKQKTYGRFLGTIFFGAVRIAGNACPAMPCETKSLQKRQQHEKMLIFDQVQVSKVQGADFWSCLLLLFATRLRALLRSTLTAPPSAKMRR